MPDPSDVELLLSHWQRALNLEHWRIRVKYVNELSIPNALMQVSPTRDRNMACISIRKSVMALSNESFEPLLVHELVHLIYDPIAEEHSLQIRFVNNEERSEEYMTRFVRALERAVEHTTQALIPLRLFKNQPDIEKEIPLLSDGTISVRITADRVEEA